MMEPTINPAFQEALRQLGRPTTPAELDRRGITHLRSIKSTEIGLLIERAVNRTLMERTIGPLDEEEMAVVLHEAENQFTRQLKDYEDLAEAKASIASHRKDMQADLVRLQSARDGVDRGARQELSERVVELRERLPSQIAACLALQPDGRVGGTGRTIVERLRALFETHVSAELHEQRRQFEVEIDIQMRRVDKLLQFLDHTEQVLARVAAAKGLDQGIASFYGAVRGIAPGESNYEIKKRMLSRMFDVNAMDQEGKRLPARSGPEDDVTTS
ncbi:MAG TPA: hypothetical protein VM509_06920 [Planctomycetota bacterium]|nr:hypothetical protein [Planctomycetota bacterium]